jgi:hypothetical protein
MLEIPRGTLILSVECPGQTVGPTGALVEGLQTLDRLLAHCGLPATWALAEPSAWRPVLRAGAAPEVAVLGDSSWAGPQASRAMFLRELERRVNPARAAGFEVSSLIVADNAPPDHCDLMYKLGLRSVRGAGPASGHAARNLRFGLWELPATLRFPAAGWFSSWRRARSARRSLAAATATQRPVHLALDGRLLSGGGMFLAQLLDSVFYAAAKRRDAGLLQVQTMAAAATALGRATAGNGASSILRPRAA